MNFMNDQEILTCSCFCFVLCPPAINDRFLTPFQASSLFTILPPNLIQLLKNEIFEGSEI